MINNRQNGRRRGRGGQQVRGGQPGAPDRGSRVDNRARGNAAQLFEKYKTLARDAQMQGDRVTTEYFLQFADHYFRVLSENRSRFEEQRPRPQADYREEYGDEGEAQEGGARAFDRQNGDDGDGWYDEGQAPQHYAPQRQPDAPQRQPQPQPQQARPRRDEGEQQPRASSEPRAEARPPAEERPQGEDRTDGEVRRPRGRPRRAVEGDGNRGGGERAEDAAPARIEIDRIPPGFSADPSPAAPPSEDGAPVPRRRPRRPREDASVDA